jgi:hypothetical protein
MDTMANLLVILLHLSALYAALGVFATAAAALAKRSALRPRRMAPSIGRRPHRNCPRRRTDPGVPGALRGTARPWWSDQPRCLKAQRHQAMVKPPARAPATP